MKNTIYLDNAATSWPKPEQVKKDIVNFIDNIGANPGRSGHRQSIEAGRKILETRMALATLFNIDDCCRIIFTKNITEALSLIIFGFLKPGDHVVLSSMEHNAVIRPLREMEKRGVKLTIVDCNKKGELNPLNIEKALQRNTKIVFLTHASNVTGTILPIKDVGQILQKKNVLFCVDSAQTAGIIPINVKEMHIDILTFTGHKSLLGPQGTGGFFIADGVEEKITPLIMGGTGSKSEYDTQPCFLPDKYESGTPNTLGIAGLGAGVSYILSQKLSKIREKEHFLTTAFLDGLKRIPSVIYYGVDNAKQMTSTLSFNIKGKSASDVALILDEKYNIMCRPGLHCAPLAHKTIGTFPEGTVRVSFGYFNSLEDVNRTLKALDAIARH